MNAMKLNSIKKGQRRIIGCVEYAGTNPVYANIAKFDEPAQYKKIKAGIPFVRV
jgi:hypothetical protein